MEASGFYITREGWTAGYSGDPWLKGAENRRWSVVVGRWQIKILEQFYMEASQTRDYGVAKGARRRAGRPDP